VKSFVPQRVPPRPSWRGHVDADLSQEQRVIDAGVREYDERALRISQRGDFATGLRRAAHDGSRAIRKKLLRARLHTAADAADGRRTLDVDVSEQMSGRERERERERFYF